MKRVKRDQPDTKEYDRTEQDEQSNRPADFRTEKVLLAIALFFCALIVGYNAFYVPPVSLPVVYGGDEDSVSFIDSEEYDALPPEETSPSQKLDLNTASKEQLAETLPGVGEVLAQRIIDYREAHPFQSVEELRNIEGIGEKTFAKIEPYVTVSQRT